MKHIFIFRYSSLPILGLLRIERELHTLNLSKLGSETRDVSRPSQDIYCKLKSQNWSKLGNETREVSRHSKGQAGSRANIQNILDYKVILLDLFPQWPINAGG